MEKTSTKVNWNSYVTLFMFCLAIMAMGWISANLTRNVLGENKQDYYRGAYYSCLWEKEVVHITGEDEACKNRVRDMYKYDMSGFYGNFDLNTVLNGTD